MVDTAKWADLQERSRQIQADLNQLTLEAQQAEIALVLEFAQHGNVEIHTYAKQNSDSDMVLWMESTYCSEQGQTHLGNMIYYEDYRVLTQPADGGIVDIDGWQSSNCW